MVSRHRLIVRPLNLQPSDGWRSRYQMLHRVCQLASQGFRIIAVLGTPPSPSCMAIIFGSKNGYCQAAYGVSRVLSYS